MESNRLKESTATIQNGVARADGKLCVTESHIHFEPYNKEFGLGPYELERKTVSKVEKCWGKGGGILPITSEAIKITLIDGTEYQFILANPEEWISLLGK
ncbi:hypothetical protein BTA51_14100 [Hahella sp. CCB-MM4]|uniref:hypothetical protein n=1 Tax=Hahella sp. (strain CCB-MM4) TaxID=1926491 RepID=UPI000B9AC571|nr:hypothetical protein [Hahella sp. CCB-MM4]OZG72658.1 hypothetical protein BTA51_14100 [Hahella sp. CCB-MM4]